MNIKLVFLWKSKIPKVLLTTTSKYQATDGQKNIATNFKNNTT